MTLLVVSELILLALAVICQAWAAGLAASLMRKADAYRLGWGCLSLALLLMIERRLVPFWNTLSGVDAPDLVNTVFGLGISLLMLLGMLGLRQLFDHLHAQRRQLHQLATTDSLTGVANRRHFLELAEHELARAARSQQPLALLMLDLDHFKRVNDCHGHATGDRVLAALGALCRAELRSGVDSVGRLGGEEFAVLLPGADLDHAATVAERLRGALAGLSLLDDQGRPLSITMSVGVVVMQPGSEEPLPTILSGLKHADAALYAAKAEGRNRVLCWSPAVGGDADRVA